MPQGRYDPFMGSLPPPNEDPRKIAQGQQQADPLGNLGQMIGQSLGAAPPPQRALNQWEILAGLSNPQLMEYVLGLKNQTPQMQQYQAGQKMLPHLLDAYGAQQRSGNFQQKEGRLEEQFKWRQMLQSQFKPETRQIYDQFTGLNKWETTYRDPMRNNMVVYQETTDYPPMHYGAVAGPGGEMYQYPTSNVPPRGQMPGGGPPQGGMPQMGGAPAPLPQPTGTPTTGSNVGGILPSGAGAQGAPPTSGNVRRLGLPKQAPAGAIDQSVRQQKFLGGLEGAFATVNAAHTAQVSRFGTSPFGMLGQIAQDKLAQGRYGRAAVAQYGDREVSDYYNKIRLSVYDYVKAQTGAQFSITEMDRYLASFPTTVDDPQTAKNLIWEHANRAVREINTLKLNWKAIQVGNQRVYVSPDYLDEFLTTGGAQSLGAPSEVQAVDPIEQMLMRAKEKASARQR